MIGSELASAWHSFFHASEMQPNLELFRIAFGSTTALYFARRLRTADLCLGPHGLAANLWALRGDPVRASIFALLPRARWLARGWIVLGLVAAAGVTLGWHTNTCALVLAIVQATLVAELVFLATGVDFIVLIMSALIAVSDAGSAWSIDAEGELEATEVWATRLMQIQVCIIYGYGVAQKLAESQWRSGWAVYYAVQALVVARPWSRRLAAFPTALRVLTWATLAAQLIAPAALWWEPTRPVAVLVLATFHIGLDLVLRLWPFQWLMLSTLLLFVGGGGAG